MSKPTESTDPSARQSALDDPPEFGAAATSTDEPEAVIEDVKDPDPVDDSAADGLEESEDSSLPELGLALDDIGDAEPLQDILDTFNDDDLDRILDSVQTQIDAGKEFEKLSAGLDPDTAALIDSLAGPADGASKKAAKAKPAVKASGKPAVKTGEPEIKDILKNVLSRLKNAEDVTKSLRAGLQTEKRRRQGKVYSNLADGTEADGALSVPENFRADVQKLVVARLKASAGSRATVETVMAELKKEMPSFFGPVDPSMKTKSKAAKKSVKKVASVRVKGQPKTPPARRSPSADSAAKTNRSINSLDDVMAAFTDEARKLRTF